MHPNPEACLNVFEQAQESVRVTPHSAWQSNSNAISLYNQRGATASHTTQFLAKAQ